MEFSKFFDNIIIKLKKSGDFEEILAKFTNLNENSKKVDFIEELLNEEIKNIKNTIELKIKKNNQTAFELCKKGNEHFRNAKDYYQSLETFSKAACFAENNTVFLGLTYSNRSAVLFDIDIFTECIENISLARTLLTPHLGDLLNERESVAEALKTIQFEDTDIPPYEFKLSYCEHPNVKNIVTHMEVRETQEMGRGIFTRSDLASGHLIGIEQPFCTYMIPIMKYVRCANCKKENYYTLIPCPNCTCTLFCDTKCMEQAFEEFHKYECPIIDFLSNFFEKHNLALRCVLLTIKSFNSLDSCMEFFNETNNQQDNIFTIDYTGENPKLENLKAILGLITNQDKHSAIDLFKFTTITAIMKHYLFQYTILQDEIIENQHRQLFTKLLFKYLLICNSNMFDIPIIEPKEMTKSDENFGVGIYPFGSLFNHSCKPNMIRVYTNTKNYLFTLEAVPANSQLFVSYCCYEATLSPENKKAYLTKQYCFECKCNVCTQSEE